jgi:hypothetical protein
MSDVVMVPLPVSRAAADALRDDARREKMGKLVSDLLRPGTPADDPLRVLIAALKASARRDGLTDEEIDADLAAYNAENRL